MVRLRLKVAEAWRDVDVQLQRRHDLVPNLARIVEGYAAHERSVLEAVAASRALAGQARGAAEADGPERALSEALGRLIAVAEAYPQLRAAQGYLDLQRQLEHTEDELSAARRIYNGNVRVYNSRIQSFPALLVAGALGFGEADFFQLAEEARAAVPVPPPVQGH
ncbi:MAG: LemA family protein [Gaiellaceae bacterium]